MNWLQRTLTTLGLAVALGGCGAATDAIRYEHGGLAYIVQHETGMSIPDMDRIQTERRTINLAEEGRLPPGYGLIGHLHADGSEYDADDEGPRYDAVIWIADTNGDGNPDLFQIVVDTQVTIAPNTRAVGRSMSARALVQDVNHDGNADRVWTDNRDADGSRRYDGTYETIQMLTDRPIQSLIDDLIWYRRRAQPQSTQPTSDTTDTSQHHINQSGDL